MKRWLATFALLLAFTPLLATEKKPYRATRFIVANGVNLNYVDWGGRGEVVLFLAGFGDDAYRFDSLPIASPIGSAFSG